MFTKPVNLSLAKRQADLPLVLSLPKCGATVQEHYNDYHQYIFDNTDYLIWNYVINPCPKHVLKGNVKLNSLSDSQIRRLIIRLIKPFLMKKVPALHSFAIYFEYGEKGKFHANLVTTWIQGTPYQMQFIIRDKLRNEFGVNYHSINMTDQRKLSKYDYYCCKDAQFMYHNGYKPVLYVPPPKIPPNTSLLENKNI